MATELECVCEFRMRRRQQPGIPAGGWSTARRPRGPRPAPALRVLFLWSRLQPRVAGTFFPPLPRCRAPRLTAPPMTNGPRTPHSPPLPANAQIILCRSRCTDKAGMG